MPATPSASSRCAYSATSCGSSEKPCSASTLIGTGRWTRRCGEGERRLAWSRSRRRATPIAAATPRLVVPIALNPAAASAAPMRDPTRSAGAAGRPAGAGQRTSLTPSASASACSRAGQARRPSPNGRPVRSTTIRFPSGSSRFVEGTGGSSPRINAAVASHACTSSATCCATASSSAGRQPLEQPPQRFVGAGRVRPGLVRRGDRPHVDPRRRRRRRCRASTATGTYARGTPSCVRGRGAQRGRVERGQARLDQRAAAGVRLALGEPGHRGAQPRHRAERAGRAGGGTG